MSQSVLIKALSNPAWLEHASMAEWDLILRQGRNADLLGQLDARVTQFGLIDKIPEAPAKHLQAARRLSHKQRSVVDFEALCLKRALDEIGQPLLLLKGGAYVIARLPSYKGRLFSDVDILVPKEKLEEAEQILIKHGWQTTHFDEYDQRYYRTWMHEIPPLVHHRRQTVLDLHHAILPETARIHPDPKKLIADAVPIEGKENMFVLAPVDMVLHSATHLFHDGELEHGLRDLVDLDALMRHFGNEEKFWGSLVERAAEMEQGRPLYYALRYCVEYLSTPVPEVALKAVTALGKPAVIAPLMDMLFRSALMPDHPSCDSWFTRRARWMLYARSHFLRMPLHLLIPHLVRKAYLRREFEWPMQNRKQEER